jgi:hypothetical protein
MYTTLIAVLFTIRLNKAMDSSQDKKDLSIGLQISLRI